MASQQQAPPRTMLRLASLARPPITLTPPTNPPPPPPPALAPAVPTTILRPVLPQLLRPPPPPEPQPKQSKGPSSTTPPSSSERQPPNNNNPGNVSVPSSPAVRISSSLPSSPASRFKTTSSLQTSPKINVPGDTSPLLNAVANRRTLPKSPPPPPPPPSPLLTDNTHSSPNPKNIGSSAYSPKRSPVSHLNTQPLVLSLTQTKSGPDLTETKIPSEPVQKTVLLQENTSESRQRHASNGNITRNSSHNHNEKRDSKEDNGRLLSKNAGGGDYGVRIITLTGDNNGAIMEVRSWSGKQHYGTEGKSQALQLQKTDNQKSQSHGETLGKSNSSGCEQEEEGVKSDQKMAIDRKEIAVRSPPLMNAFVNSNVQGVNNSVMYNVNCSQHDPGVHLSLGKKAIGGRGFFFKEKR